MKVLALVLAATLALASFPAAARGSFHPHVSVGIGLGFPHYYYGPFGYDPWYPYGYAPYGYAPYPVRVYRDDRAADDKAAPNLYVYPQAGQSEAKVSQDRSECHDWAVGQSDFDPATAKRQKESDLANYDRAFTACMSGRNYSVG